MKTTIHMTPANKPMLQKVQLEKIQRTSDEVEHTDFQIYTDDSTTNGTRNGGAGMIIARDKNLLHRWHAATVTRSSAYSAGKAALEAALKWLKSEIGWHRAVIVCDCKSIILSHRQSTPSRLDHCHSPTVQRQNHSL